MAKLDALRRNPFFRYLAPFFLFMLLGSLQDLVTGEAVWCVYALKLVAALGLFGWCFSGRWHEIEGRFDPLAILTGIAVLVVWITWCKLFPGGTPAMFNPAAFHSPVWLAVAIIVRITGACIAAPLLEEIVWRSFIMRFFIKEDFLSVPLGTYSAFSFWLTVLTFAFMHPLWQWGAAIFAGFAYSFYLVRSKNLAGCIIAHGVTNFGLAMYILISGEWALWN